MSKHTGWICPRCGASNAPKVKQCACSAAHKVNYIEPYRCIWVWKPPYFYPPYTIWCDITTNTITSEPSISSVWVNNNTFGTTVSAAVYDQEWSTSSTTGWLTLDGE